MVVVVVVVVVVSPLVVVVVVVVMGIRPGEANSRLCFFGLLLRAAPSGCSVSSANFVRTARIREESFRPHSTNMLHPRTLT